MSTEVKTIKQYISEGRTPYVSSNGAVVLIDGLKIEEMFIGTPERKEAFGKAFPDLVTHQ